MYRWLLPLLLSISGSVSADRNAFGHPDSGLGPVQRMEFVLGRALFKRLWAVAPGSARAADGLGPLYNARSCMQCHVRNGRGRPEGRLEDHERTPGGGTLILRLARPDGSPDPVYGRQLQVQAVVGHAAEGRIIVRYAYRTVTLADGLEVELRTPEYRVEDWGYGAPARDIGASPRLAPVMIGLGLLEHIDERDILSWADPYDWDGDGVSGRASRVYSPALRRYALGRFGWKARMATLDEQNQSAFSADIGLSVPLHPSGAGECTQAQVACLQAPDGNMPRYDNLEVHRGMLDPVLSFIRNLSVPERRDMEDPQVLSGEQVFVESGCARCHRPRFKTGRHAADGSRHAHLAGREIRPYTDLLLHDMGAGLADAVSEGDVPGREWRTAPLWGIGHTKAVSGHTYFLHDGRARNLLEAILWHGGEAQAARDAVVALDRPRREALLRFLNSLWVVARYQLLRENCHSVR